MLFILALLAAPSGGPLLLADEILVVPPSQWRALDVSLRQRPAAVECVFDVAGEHPRVRAILLSQSDAARMKSGKRHAILASTAYQLKGRFRVALAQPGDYRLVLDNRLEGRSPAQVRVRVWLDFFPSKRIPVRYPSPRQQWLSISLGLGIFFAAASFAGWKIKNALCARRTPPLSPPCA